MIVRVWRGWTTAEDADRYAAYMTEMALPGYSDVEGNLAVYMTRSPDGDREEFAMFTVWESEAALVGFAGPDRERAVFFAEDDQFLVDRELTVSHYDVYGSHLS